MSHELDPTTTPEPRLVSVSRKAFVQRTAAAGFALAMIGGLAACGTNDANALAATETTEAATTATSEEVVATTEAASTTSEEASTSEAETTVSAATAQTMEVSFTYEASGESGGRGGVKNPYIAVWVEDADGNLVDTISVWNKSGKGEKWLDDLRQWYSVSDKGGDVSMSSATKVAGAYTVAWDGTDLDGNTVADGDYTLYIEAAREHGPYSLTSSPVTVGDGQTISLPDDGEILAATAQFV